MRTLLRAVAIGMVGVASVLPVASAQDRAVAGASPQTDSVLRNLAEWFRRQLPKMGTHTVVEQWSNGTRMGHDYSIRSASLKNCTLVLEVRDYQTSQYGQGSSNKKFTIQLPDLDLRRLSAMEARVVGTASAPSYWANIFARQDLGKVVKVEPPRDSTIGLNLRLSSMAFARMVTDSVREAAQRCGAPTVSVAAAPPAVQNPNPNASAAPSSSGTAVAMTNDDVIKLVAAGLAAEVVVNAVRQAPAKSFDLAPSSLLALKNANVPDSVILAMQASAQPRTIENPTRAQPPPRSAAVEKPTYDPSLTANGCDGIDNMGLFESRPMPGAVIYLVKIRNNNSVAKLVTFSWVNEYGEEKRRQIQIRGGEIATIDLDLNQSRVIPTVKNIQLVTCR